MDNPLAPNHFTNDENNYYYRFEIQNNNAILIVPI